MRVGGWPTHPPTAEFFSDFWIFLTWQNPLELFNMTTNDQHFSEGYTN